MGRAWKAFVLSLAGVAATVTLTGAALAVVGSGLSSPANAVHVSAPLLAPPHSHESRAADKHATRTPGTAAPATSSSTDVLNRPAGSTVEGGEAPSVGASATATTGTPSADESSPSDDESHHEEHPDEDEDHGDD